MLFRSQALSLSLTIFAACIAIATPAPLPTSKLPFTTKPAFIIQPPPLIDSLQEKHPSIPHLQAHFTSSSFGRIWRIKISSSKTFSYGTGDWLHMEDCDNEKNHCIGQVTKIYHMEQGWIIFEMDLESLTSSIPILVAFPYRHSRISLFQRIIYYVFYCLLSNDALLCYGSGSA